MFKTFRYRLYPTKAQTIFLEGQLREACDLYNCALEERKSAWDVCRKQIGLYEQELQLKPMRAEGLVNIPNYMCSANVLRRVDRAFRAFFRRCKSGGRPGFPRYRSMQRYDSISFPQYGNGCRLLNSGKLRVQGAGHIKVRLHRPISGTIKIVTIKREAGRWYVCFEIEYSPEDIQPSEESIGIDLGVEHFAVLSSGEEIDNPRCFRTSASRLRKCSRKASRRKKGSNRRRKAVLLLQRAHAHISNQRADFHHKLSRQIVNRFGFIAVEDLNVKGLASGMLAKSVHDAGWGQFIEFLSYKAEDAGRELVKVDPRGTSQTCVCGARVPKALKDRWHHCPACELLASRDHVSAQVILQRAGNRPSGANVEVVNSCVV